ncbi:MAG: hypothetical protein IIT53_06910 [Fibrobacter sp.]|nr:hypothetical protein [Fibrobacter sp.]
MDMLTEVNLKDKNYLKAYEEQIQALPLDELYEVLDIIKHDPSRERIDIVEKRIQELEDIDNFENGRNYYNNLIKNEPEKIVYVDNKKENPQEKIELPPVNDTQVKENKTEETKSDRFYIEPHSSNCKRKLSEEELNEVRLFAHLVDEKYKNAPPPPPPRRHTPASTLFNWFLFVLLFGNWVFVNTKGGYFMQKGALVYYPEHSISYSITTASYFCLVGCFIIVRCYKKEASIGLSIASFFWIKSLLGFFEGIYPGFFVTPSASLSRIISISILISSSLYVIKVVKSKEKSYLKMTLLMVLLCLAIEQVGWLG